MIWERLSPISLSSRSLIAESAAIEGPRREVAASSRELMDVLNELCRLREDAAEGPPVEARPNHAGFAGAKPISKSTMETE